MIKRFPVLLIAFAMFGMLAFAQNSKVENMQGKTLVVDKPTTQNTVVPDRVAADGNYVEVDVMGNVFGTGSGDINPIAYDPYSNTIALIHRADPSYTTLGTGELWYNMSTDGGVTWTRVASINGAATQQLGRYPSMCISNSSKGDINSTTAVFAWPELLPGATNFGWLGWGVDQPVGAGATFSDIIVSTADYSTEEPVWADDNSDWVFWTARSLAVNAAVTLFRTQDFVTIEESVPTQWGDDVFSSNGQYVNGGVARNGVQYFAATGAYNATIFPAGQEIGWAMGYSKSTDQGVTWSTFSVPDFRTIPDLADYDEYFDFDSTDGNTVQFDGDIQVDKWGYVHLVTALTDTNNWSHAVVDIYETASGWDGEVIFHGLDIKTYGAGPGIGQMGAAPFVAMDTSGTVMGVQWINKSPNTPWADVYFSHKRLDQPDTWSAPENLTMSDSINNTAAHLAPQLKDNGDGTFTAYSMYVYTTGRTGPYGDSLGMTSIYVAPVTFDESASAVGDDNNPVNSFELAQNYPNPFNPSTQIKYTIGERSNVSLKVFDVLGNEVANLVNQSQDAGSYNVTFDAANLTSGLYIYKLQAGNFTEAKKMMLLK